MFNGKVVGQEFGGGLFVGGGEISLFQCLILYWKQTFLFALWRQQPSVMGLWGGSVAGRKQPARAALGFVSFWLWEK